METLGGYKRSVVDVHFPLQTGGAYGPILESRKAVVDGTVVTVVGAGFMCKNHLIPVFLVDRGEGLEVTGLYDGPSRNPKPDENGNYKLLPISQTGWNKTEPWLDEIGAPLIIPKDFIASVKRASSALFRCEDASPEDEAMARFRDEIYLGYVEIW